MFVKSRLCATAIGIALTAASLSAQQTASRPPRNPAPAPRLPDEPSSGETLSPLHAFLGIDPITGEFKPRNASPRANAPRTQSGTPSGTEAGSELSAELPLGETTLDDFRAAVTEALEEHNDEALAATLANLTRGVSGYDQLSLMSSRAERLGYLALFLYPLGIVLSELYGVWSRRGLRPRSPRDRRYYSRQCARRLALAACSTATIGLFWWAGEHRFWRNDLERLVPIAAAMALTLTLSAGLRLIIARAARDYPVQVIEDLRMQQFLLENEIKELRRRLQGEAIADAV